VPVKLPRSGMTAAISTKQFDGAVDAPYRRGVPPDIEVPEAAEVIPNSIEDPVLQAALRSLARAWGSADGRVMLQISLTLGQSRCESRLTV
jgi:hypothetical protein